MATGLPGHPLQCNVYITLHYSAFYYSGQLQRMATGLPRGPPVHSRDSSLLSGLSDSFSSSYCSRPSSHSRQASLLSSLRSSPSSHSRQSSQLSDYCHSPPPLLPPSAHHPAPFNAILHFRQPSASSGHHSRYSSLQEGGRS
jgi:hypothetical protein